MTGWLMTIVTQYLATLQVYITVQCTYIHVQCTYCTYIHVQCTYILYIMYIHTCTMYIHTVQCTYIHVYVQCTYTWWSITLPQDHKQNTSTPRKDSKKSKKFLELSRSFLKTTDSDSEKDVTSQIKNILESTKIESNVMNMVTNFFNLSYGN